MPSIQKGGIIIEVEALVQGLWGAHVDPKQGVIAVELHLSPSGNRGNVKLVTEVLEMKCHAVFKSNSYS